MTSLSPAERAGVESLVERCREADGVSPLNEAAWLALARPGRHLLHRSHESEDAPVLGYAQVAEDQTVQLCVDPEHRRRLIGSGLADRADRADHADRAERADHTDRTEQADHANRADRAELPEQAEQTGRSGRNGQADLPVRGWWAFGELESARGFAQDRGLVVGRELLIMERPLTGPVAESSPVEETPPPPGVTIRTFVPGQDEQAWLAVNARAFAHHPEQGHLTLTDLHERMAEDWFDPDGFFLAERDNSERDKEVIGFHWTKVHPATEDAPARGEVYVLGVDPSASGGGLGRALLAHGLRSLQARGLGSVLLYVEASEHRVVRMYESANFGVTHRDALFVPPRLGTDGPASR